MSGALLVAGTTSDAGKSLLTAGICRWLARRGVKVAPFKAQNMSNNSVVTAEGGEIGRAQALQAAACGLEPSVRFNPVLLKPGSDRTSQVVVLGQADGEVSALSYRDRKPALLSVVLDTLRELRSEFDAVICEGAGSPAEINLRATDIANMGLASAAGLPVIVVGDIDRGGVFAALYGTLALLSPADQRLVSGFVVNKFRGDPALLAPGLAAIERLTGRPVLGTIPWLPGLRLDGEDSLSYATGFGPAAPPVGSEVLRVAVARLPRISNSTDLDALAAEPGVEVVFAEHPAALAGADLVVLPGTRSTVDDLGWLHRTGLAAAVSAHASRGGAVLGICGGFQMLAEAILDEVESGAGEVPGLGLLPIRVAFATRKALGRPSGSYSGVPVNGYEIHYGRVASRAGGLSPMFTAAGGGGEGAIRGTVFGTHWHGAFESDAFRRAFLTDVAAIAGRHGFTVASGTDYSALRLSALDTLGDAVEQCLDTAALERLLDDGPSDGLPILSTAADAAAWHPDGRTS